MKNKILSILLAVTMIVALFIPMVAVSAETITPGHIAISFGTPTIDDYDGALVVPVEVAENTGDIFTAKIYVVSLNDSIEAGYWEDGDISDIDEGGRRPVTFGLAGLLNAAEASVTFDRTEMSDTSSTGVRTTGTLGYMYFYTKDGSDIDPADLTNGTYKFGIGEDSMVSSFHGDGQGSLVIHTVAHHHTPYKDTVNDPDGCKQEKCTYCGEVFATIDHKFTNYVAKDPAECGKNATEEAECDNGCGEKDVRDVADSALEHSFTNYVYQDDAKCGVNGTEVAECDNNCGETDVRSKDGTALEHSYTNYVYQNDAKCEIDGTEVAECDNGCGNTDTRAKAGTALTHSYTEYVYNQDAKCGEDGTKTAECDNNCGETDTIKADGTALVHSYTNYVSNNDAKCGVDGTETAECDNECGETDTRADVGSALTHSYTNYVSNNDEKCGVDGTETAECDHDCGNHDTRTKVGSALEHSFTNYVSNNDATTTGNCTETAECDHGCGEKDTLEILGTMLVPEVDLDGIVITTGEGNEIPGDTYIIESDATVDKNSIKGYEAILAFTFYSYSSEDGLDGISGTLGFDMSDLPTDEYDGFVFGVIGADGKVTIIEDTTVDGDMLYFDGALTDDYIFLAIPKEDVSDTSDNFDMVIYVAIALASVIGLAVVGKKRFAL